MAGFVSATERPLRPRAGLAAGLCGLAATALVACHALVDFSLQIPAVAAWFATLLGLGYAQSWSSARGGTA